MFDPKMLETVDHRDGHWQIQRFRDARPGLFEYAVQAGFVAAADGGREIDEQWLPHSSDKDVEYRKVSPRSRGEDGSLAIGWERVAPCFRRGEVIRLVDQPDTTMGDGGMRVAQNHPFDARNTLLRLEDQAYMNRWDRDRYAVAACKDQYRRLDPPRYEPVPGTIWHAGAGGSSYTFVVLSDEGCGISHADDERCKTVLFSDGSRGFWAFSSPPREEYRGGLTDEQLAEADQLRGRRPSVDMVDSATYAIDELLGLASVTRQGVTVELDPMPALLARLDTIIELLSDGEVVTAPEPVAGKFRATRLDDDGAITGDATDDWVGVTRPLSITFEDVKIDEHTYELLFGRPQPEPAAPTAVRPGQLWGFTGDDTRLRVRWVEGGHAFLVEERADGTTGEPWAPATKSMLQLSSGYRLLEDTPAGTFYIGSANATDIRSIASVDLP